MKSSKIIKKIYCFDTSAFITLKNTSEMIIELPESLWNYLERMMDSNEIISHMVVFEEICGKGQKPDFLEKWLSGKKKSFFGKTKFQIMKVSEIVKAFPSLIDPNSEHEQADPWIIALAIEKSGENNLFESCVAPVVSQESQKSSKKIPAACNHFDVGHLSLKSFFTEVGLMTSVTKK